MRDDDRRMPVPGHVGVARARAVGPERPVSFLGRSLPPSFRRRVVVLRPGERQPFVAADWQGALVVVECGQLGLACTDGGVRCFPQGAILHLDGLPLVSLLNQGEETLVVVAVVRSAEGDRRVVEG